MGVIWLLLTLLISSSGAEEIELERISVVVNDGVVLASEWEQRVAQQQARSGIDEFTEDLRQQVLEALILETIQLQIAARFNISADLTAVNRVLRDIARQQGITLTDYLAWLQQQGQSANQIREEIRRALIIQRVQSAQLRDRLQVTDSEVQDFLSTQAAAEAFGVEFRVGFIRYSLSEDASSLVQDTAEQAIQEVFNQLQESDFRTVSDQLKDATSVWQAQDLGWLPALRLPSLFAEVVPGMTPGTTHSPLRNASGWYTITLIDQRFAARIADELQIRRIYLQPDILRDATQTKNTIDALHQQLLNGVDFSTLAAMHRNASEVFSGETLPWRSTAEFEPSTMAILRSLEVGQFTAPIPRGEGWELLQLVAVRQRDVSAEWVFERVRDTIQERKLQIALPAWLRQIRRDAFVKIL